MEMYITCANTQHTIPGVSSSILAYIQQTEIPEHVSAITTTNMCLHVPGIMYGKVVDVCESDSHVINVLGVESRKARAVDRWLYE